VTEQGRVHAFVYLIDPLFYILCRGVSRADLYLQQIFEQVVGELADIADKTHVEHPVCAAAITSLPERTAEIPWTWTGKGVEQPFSSIA